MAKRYGGAHSPTPRSDHTPAQNPLRRKSAARTGFRSNMLFVAALPLGWKAFGAGPITMAAYLVGFGLLIAAAYMTREGLKAQDAYDARSVARRPAVPRKIFGSMLTGLAMGCVGWAGYGPLESGLFTLIGAALHSLAFGFDPLKHKGMEGVDTFQQDRVSKAVSEAESHLEAMRSALKKLGDRQAETRLERFITTARDMFRTVEEDPRDLTAARKYLGVYLSGARAATEKFAKLYERSANQEARASWFALLDDLEANFAAHNKALLSDDKGDLDIEIDVLRERLATEGVKT